MNIYTVRGTTANKEDIPYTYNVLCTMNKTIPIQTLHLFPVIDKMLIELLNSLTAEEWNAQTVAKLWKVKDVASHLLDGNVRALSISRDGFFGEKATNINSYQDLVAFLNNLNLTWTNATKRISPKLLTFLLEITGQQYTQHLHSLEPFSNALFSVAWSGQEVSPNWFHIAREYTEKYLHQQQIRDAVNKPGLMTKEFFYPFIDTLMYAFPFTFREVSADDGTTVSLIVTSDIGGQWNIVKTDSGWTLNKETGVKSNATVRIDPNTTWKLFSKSWRPEQVMDQVEISGDTLLGQNVLRIVAFMA